MSHAATVRAHGVGRNLRNRPAMLGSWQIGPVAARYRPNLSRITSAGRTRMDVVLVAVAVARPFAGR